MLIKDKNDAKDSAKHMAGMAEGYREISKKLAVQDNTLAKKYLLLASCCDDIAIYIKSRVEQ